MAEILTDAGITKVIEYAEPAASLAAVPHVEPSIVIVALDMPQMNGLDYLAALRPYALTRIFLPIIAVSREDTDDLREGAFELGARDFIPAPVRRADLVQRTRNLLETSFLYESEHKSNLLLEHRVRERTTELMEANLEIINRLAVATNFRDDITGSHVKRVGSLSELIALELGLPQGEAEAIGIAARLHDLGKIAIPDSILQKAGPLDDLEMQLMRSHTTVGASMLGSGKSKLIQLAEEIALTHHERWDGRGYPTGLAEENIPLAGRICAVADVFDSLTSERQYKQAWTVENALREIEAHAGTQFDPEVVKAFCRIFNRSDDPLKLAA